MDGFQIATYSSLPEQIDTWFKAWHKAVEMCGTSSTQRRAFIDREIAYLDSYVRGAYAKRDLVAGQKLSEDHYYMAIPLQKGQVSSCELMLGKFGHKLLSPCLKDQPISVDILDTPYSGNETMLKSFRNRGI